MQVDFSALNEEEEREKRRKNICFAKIQTISEISKPAKYRSSHLVMGASDFYALIMGASDFDALIMGASGFYAVIMGASGFYAVIMGASGFYALSKKYYEINYVILQKS